MFSPARGWEVTVTDESLVVLVVLIGVVLPATVDVAVDVVPVAAVVAILQALPQGLECPRVGCLHEVQRLAPDMQQLKNWSQLQVHHDPRLAGGTLVTATCYRARY